MKNAAQVQPARQQFQIVVADERGRKATTMLACRPHLPEMAKADKLSAWRPDEIRVPAVRATKDNGCFRAGTISTS